MWPPGEGLSVIPGVRPRHCSHQHRAALQKDREMVGRRQVVGQKTTVASLKRYVLNELRLLNVELGLSGICEKAISRETT